MVDEGRRKWLYLLGAVLLIVTPVSSILLNLAVNGQLSWWYPLVWFAVLIFATYFYMQRQAQFDPGSADQIDRRIDGFAAELADEVRIRSYGARDRLIEDPLRQLELDITPIVGRRVRDHRLAKREPISEEATDIVTAFESAGRRLLIVGEPGSGKTMAAYSLIEHLNESEGHEPIALLVNLSAWGEQEDFKAFLVDYLCSSVGYEANKPDVAKGFVSAGRYSLVLDGLDEVPPRLRVGLCKRLDDFVRRLRSKVAVVVTCRSQECEELWDDYLRFLQAVEVLPLTSQQLDDTFEELAKEVNGDWKTLLSPEEDVDPQRVRNLLSNPLFLNLAVAGRLSPCQLLRCNEDQALLDLVLDGYLTHKLDDQKQYKPGEARRYLAWIARFLNGDNVSPFDLYTGDSAVFGLANLTPPVPTARYRLTFGLVFGLVGGLVGGLFFGLVFGLVAELVVGLITGLVLGMTAGLTDNAVSGYLALSWPRTRQQLLSFLSRLVVGLVGGLVFGLVGGLVGGLVVGLVVGLFLGLVETQPALIKSRIPKEELSHSLNAVLIWELVFALVVGLAGGLVFGLAGGLVFGLVVGLVGGLIFGLDSGGWFVVLQWVAHRRLYRARNLPRSPYEFLEWGIKMQIFRPVGAGVRFRHDLIQQRLSSTQGTAL